MGPGAGEGGEELKAAHAMKALVIGRGAVCDATVAITQLVTLELAVEPGEMVYREAFNDGNLMSST
jgi:hypothetical protein